MEPYTNPAFSLQNEPLPNQYALDVLSSGQGKQTGAREQIMFWRDPALSNLELLRATYLTHTFAPHMHEGYAIGVIDKGAEQFKYRHGLHVAPEGCIVVINPGEMHTGESASSYGWSYRMFYPDVSFLQKAASDLTGKQQAIPFFPAPVIHDPVMARLLSQLHAALANSVSRLERESILTWTLAQLISRHADIRPIRPVSTIERPAVLKVRLYLEEHFTENVSLEQLATLVNLSPFYLLRVFREAVGLPPHSYLTQIRVAHAKRLIGAARPLAEIAMAVGFTDQSHLSRHFKAQVGVTPGQYARGSR